MQQTTKFSQSQNRPKPIRNQEALALETDDLSSVPDTVQQKPKPNRRPRIPSIFQQCQKA
jgi:hypothetical protein